MGFKKSELEEKIRSIVGDVQCPNNFRCCASDLQDICKAQNIGVNSFIRCLFEEPENCKFAVPLGSTYLCKCPVRALILEKLGK